MKVRSDRYRNWGPVTGLETGEVYATSNEAAKAIGLKTSEMVRMSVMLGRACKGLHFADGRLAGEELEKARHELEMKARQNLDRGGQDPQAWTHHLYASPRKWSHHKRRHRRPSSADGQDTGRTCLLLETGRRTTCINWLNDKK